MTRLRSSLFVVLVVLLATAALTGCVVRRYTLGNGPRPTSGGYAQPQGQSTIRASGPASNVIGQLTQLMQSHGWQLLDSPLRNPGLPANGTAAFAITAQGGYCYVAAAIAEDPRTDLNMFVTGPDQRTVVSDVRLDGHPSATFCPPYAGTYVVRLNFRGNGGPFFFGAYYGTRAATPDLASFYATDAQQGGVPVSPMDEAARARLAERDRQLAAQGFQRVGDPVGLGMTERGERTFPLQLEAGACYAFASTANSTIADSDLFLTSGSGANLTDDHASASDALVQHCPTESGAFQLRTRAWRGAGTLFMTSYYRPAQGSAGATPVQQGPILSTATSVDSNAIDEAFALADAEFRARGYEPYGTPTEGELDEQASREIPLELEGGKCYAIAAAGDAEVRQLSLFLVTSRGQTLDRDIEQGSTKPVVRVCPETTGTYTARVLMGQGEGRFALQAYRWPRGTRGPFGLSGVIFLRLAEMMRLLEAEGYEPDIAFSPERGSLPRAQTRGTHTLELAANTCYAMLVVGGDGVSDLGVRLARENTTLTEDRSTNAFPVLYRRTTTAETVALETRAVAGAGDYVVQLFKSQTCR